MDEATSRANAYLAAGADCIYPIGLSDLDSLKRLVVETSAPINVYAWSQAPAMRDLEAIGVRRLSLGPGLIKTSLTAMRRVARDLMEYGSYDSFSRDVMSSDEITACVSSGPQPDSPESA